MAYSDESELITQIRRLINEPTALIHSDTDITAWIDRGAEEISKMTLCNESFAATKLVTGDYDYVGTGSDFNLKDCIEVESVMYWAGQDPDNNKGTTAYSLVKTHPRQMGQNRDNTAGAPKEWWYIDGSNTLYIWPPPSASENGHYIQVLYYSQADTYNDGANIPDHLREYVIWYAAARAFEREGKYAQHEQYMSIFNNFCNFHRMDRHKIPADSKDMMKTQDKTQYIQQG